MIMNLDQVTDLKKLDPANVYQSILNLPKQIKQTYENTKNLSFPEGYKDIDEVLVCGMGGSSLGAHFVSTLLRDSIKVPFTIVNGYEIPGFVNKNTLVILSSNSGTTEEIISCLNLAKEKTDKIYAITTGGKLKEEVDNGNIQGYIFSQELNIAGQPRLAVSYTIVSIMAVLKHLKLLDYDNSDIEDAIMYLENKNTVYDIKVNASGNITKEYAYKIYEKLPIIVGTEFTEGAAHTFANQINETSKNLSIYFIIPELNHHLLEGLVHPSIVHSDSIFIFINSEFYHKRDKARIDITKQILTEKKIEYIEINLKAKNKIAQAFEMLQVGSFITLYLAILYKQDPCPIKTVDYFKEQLSKADQ
jgi:glucose/mannose-6-phosphate isomerase